jgi:hypothetical protein
MVVVDLERAEAGLVAGLVDQLTELLDPPAATEPDPLAGLVDLPPERVDAPDDPVLRRLLPDAYAPGVADRAQRSAEFRRLTDGELRRTKAAALRDLATAAAGGEVRLDEEQAAGWLHALTDLRLALGTRLDITEELDIARELGAPAKRSQIDPERWEGLVIYDWLSVIQDALVQAVSADDAADDVDRDT